MLQGLSRSARRASCDPLSRPSATAPCIEVDFFVANAVPDAPVPRSDGFRLLDFARGDQAADQQFVPPGRSRETALAPRGGHHLPQPRGFRRYSPGRSLRRGGVARPDRTSARAILYRGGASGDPRSSGPPRGFPRGGGGRRRLRGERHRRRGGDPRVPAPGPGGRDRRDGPRLPRRLERAHPLVPAPGVPRRPRSRALSPVGPGRRGERGVPSHRLAHAGARGGPRDERHRADLPRRGVDGPRARGRRGRSRRRGARPRHVGARSGRCRRRLVRRQLPQVDLLGEGLRVRLEESGLGPPARRPASPGDLLLPGSTLPRGVRLGRDTGPRGLALPARRHRLPRAHGGPGASSAQPVARPRGGRSARRGLGPGASCAPLHVRLARRRTDAGKRHRLQHRRRRSGDGEDPRGARDRGRCYGVRGTPVVQGVGAGLQPARGLRPPRRLDQVGTRAP